MQGTPIVEWRPVIGHFAHRNAHCDDAAISSAWLLREAREMTPSVTVKPTCASVTYHTEYFEIKILLSDMTHQRKQTLTWTHCHTEVNKCIRVI